MSCYFTWDKRRDVGEARLVVTVIDFNYVMNCAPKRPLSESKNGESKTIEVFSRKIELQVLARRRLIVERASAKD